MTYLGVLPYSHAQNTLLLLDSCMAFDCDCWDLCNQSLQVALRWRVSVSSCGVVTRAGLLSLGPGKSACKASSYGITSQCHCVLEVPTGSRACQIHFSVNTVVILVSTRYIRVHVWPVNLAHHTACDTRQRTRPPGGSENSRVGRCCWGRDRGRFPGQGLSTSL